MATGPHNGPARSYPAWVVRLARLVLSVFFRRIEIVGERNLAGLAGPLLFVANHNNGLVDPLLVIGLLPGRPRFLAKSTLWRNPAVRPFLALGRVIPVHRRQDPGFDPGRNEEAFARCREVLAAGGAVALFPEGRSHSEPGLAELRTGAARVLLGADDPRVGETTIVPVGLLFDAAHRFRSSVLVRIGEPFSARDPSDPGSPTEVRELTDRIGRALEEVIPGYGSWEEARLLERAVDVYLRDRPDLPVSPGLAEREPWRRGFLDVYREMEREEPGRLAPLARAVGRYDRLLAVLGLTDAQVAASYPGPAVARWVAKTLLLLVLLLPLAVAGTLLSYLPYRICGWLGSRVARHPDQPASYKMFGGLILFPATWVVEVAIAWHRLGPGWGLGVLVLALAGGWAGIRFRDRWGSLWSETLAWLRLRASERPREELARYREAIREELVDLVERRTGP